MRCFSKCYDYFSKCYCYSCDSDTSDTVAGTERRTTTNPRIMTATTAAAATATATATASAPQRQRQPKSSSGLVVQRFRGLRCSGRPLRLSECRSQSDQLRTVALLRAGARSSLLLLIRFRKNMKKPCSACTLGCTIVSLLKEHSEL